MPDIVIAPPPPIPPVVAPGKDSTEYFLTKCAMIFGVLLTVLGGVTDILTTLGTVLPGNTSIGKLLVVLGVATTIISKLAYLFGRVSLKKAALAGAPLSLDDAAKELSP